MLLRTRLHSLQISVVRGPQSVRAHTDYLACDYLGFGNRSRLCLEALAHVLAGATSTIFL